jgi:Zn-finger nucleic acid-binding protein
MKCPKDQAELSAAKRYGIDVDQCPKCGGMWLDYSELDALEDKTFKEDEFKGSLSLSQHESSYACPVCSSPLKSFQYRMNNLVLEQCPALHGFWLDAEEDKRILALLDKRSEALTRKFSAEREWGKYIKRLRSPSLADQVRRILGL